MYSLRRSSVRAGRTQRTSTVLIAPFDKSCVNDVEKAIRDSDLGVNPSNDGNVVRCVLRDLLVLLLLFDNIVAGATDVADRDTPLLSLSLGHLT
jgi:hypothetical protein